MNSKYNKLILISTSLGAFIIPFMASSVNIALPSISNDLTISSIPGRFIYDNSEGYDVVYQP